MEHIITEELISDVKQAVSEKNEDYLLEIIDEMRPADLADLIEHLDSEERQYIFRILEPDGAGDVLVEIEPPVKESIVSSLDNKAITEIIEGLDSDDAADLFSDLPDERAQEIIGGLDREASEELQKLLPYPEDSAGGIMALEFLAVKADSTVQEAVNSIRDAREKVENMYYVFVVDEDEKLAGVISMKDLVVEPHYTPVSRVMNTEVIAADVNMDQEEVAFLFKKYNLVVVPVVDEEGKLVGRITHDDIIDVIEKEADEDMSLMAGVIRQEIMEDSTVKISRARLPWLFAGMFGGILAALVINQFESSLEKIIALSFFFPVIMAMGGNTGIQAATVAVRGLATGDISLVSVWKRLWVEMKAALLNGIICGLALGLVVGFWLSDYGLGSVIAFSLIVIIFTSGLIGAAIPLALKRLRVDPALAAGPFVTTSNDILSLLVYLGLVTLFLHFTA